MGMLIMLYYTPYILPIKLGNMILYILQHNQGFDPIILIRPLTYDNMGVFVLAFWWIEQIKHYHRLHSLHFFHYIHPFGYIIGALVEQWNSAIPKPWGLKSPMNHSKKNTSILEQQSSLQVMSDTNTNMARAVSQFIHPWMDKNQMDGDTITNKPCTTWNVLNTCNKWDKLLYCQDIFHRQYVQDETLENMSIYTTASFPCMANLSCEGKKQRKQYQRVQVWYWRMPVSK